MMAGYRVNLAVALSGGLLAGALNALSAAALPTATAELGFETLFASDILLTDTSARYGQKQAGTEWNLTLTYATIALDYQPFASIDRITQPRELFEGYFGGQVSLRQALHERLTLLAVVGAYDGYTDYRSLWLSESYRQRFSFFPDYAIPNPKGFNVGSGLRWEYLRATAFAEAVFAYQNDTIAPGIEMEDFTAENPEPGIIKGRGLLHTYSPGLKFENILTSRVRLLNELGLTITSGREPRYAYRGSVNVALWNHWVLRASGGHTHEDPTLRAWHAGATLEFEITRAWLIGVSGRYYRDTGEIENSRAFSTATPGLETVQVGLSLRYVTDRHSFKVAAGPHFANYEPADIGTAFYSNLYKDRPWGFAQAAWTFQF